MARRGRASTLAQGDGSRDDLLQAGGFWYQGGVWDGSWLDWTWFNIAPDLRRRLNVAGPKTGEEAAKAWEQDKAGRDNTGR